MTTKRKAPTTPSPKKASRSTPEATEPITSTLANCDGELPTPELLTQYEQILPGSAARLFELAETRATQKRELERKTCETQLFLAKCKQLAYFALALITGIFGGVVLLGGSELAGLMILLIDAAAIAGSIIYRHTE